MDEARMGQVLNLNPRLKIELSNNLRSKAILFPRSCNQSALDVELKQEISATSLCGETFQSQHHGQRPHSVSDSKRIHCMTLFIHFNQCL